MEYANLSSYERLTGKYLFTPLGDTGAIDLGNLTAVKNALGPKSVEVMLNQRGTSVLARKDTTSVAEVFTINGDQFATPIIPLLLMGDAAADYSQSSATGAIFNITAKLGRSFPIGAYNVANVVVTVSAATKTLGVDYFLDAYNGLISFPVVAAGIAADASVVVTFDKPALTMEAYTALSKLNRQGSMIVFLEDEYGPPAKEIWTAASVQLTTKDFPDAADPSKFRTWAMEMSVFGKPTVNKRKT